MYALDTNESAHPFVFLFCTRRYTMICVDSGQRFIQFSSKFIQAGMSSMQWSPLSSACWTRLELELDVPCLQIEPSMSPVLRPIDSIVGTFSFICRCRSN